MHNLPPQPTPFVGREAELSEILRLLSDSSCRLLTLAAPGGMGKTRLALQAGQRIADEQAAFAEGTWFVPLQPVSDPEFIIPAIAAALHFQFYGAHEPRQQLLDYLCGQSLLLILDNFEHLQPGASFLSDLLSAAPHVRLLVTSRERLNLIEEWVLEIGGLRLPQQESETRYDAYSAVQLFTQSARRVRADFAISDANHNDIVRICRQVEGMPLALELAAGWTRALSCRQIADQLEQGLDILAATARNVPERHRSMRDVLHQAWNLLSQSEQAVCQKLSVFRGGFDRAAGEIVAGATMPLLLALLDKSWLQWDEKQQRYRMHELLRQYSAEHLQADVTAWQAANDHHCHYYGAFLHSQWKHLGGSRSIEALHELETEWDNIRTYWTWAIEHEKSTDIEAALDCLWFFYDTGSRFHEGEQFFAQAAERLRSDTSQRVLLGKVLARQGSLLGSLSHYEAARRLLQESLDLLRMSDAVKDLAFALFRTGVTLFGLKEFDKARPYFQESFELYQSLDLHWGMGHTLHWLGIGCEFTGELEKAQQLFQQSLAIFEDSGHAIGIASVKSQWGQVALAMGNPAQAAALVQAGLKIFQEAGIIWGIAMSYDRLCVALLESAKYDEALPYAFQALSIATRYGLQVQKLLALGRIARLWHFLGRYERSAELASFLIVHLHPEDRKRYHDLLAKLRDKLPPL